MSAPKRSAAPSHRSRWQRFAIAVPVMLASSGLSAQVAPPYVQYGPLATSIPTLSGWAFLLLAMFMLAAVWHMKRKDRYQGSKFLIISLTVGALASAASGVQLVSNANAFFAEPIIIPLVFSGGRTIPLEPQRINCLQNMTNVPQQIIKIDRNTNGGAPSQTTNPQGTGNFGSCSADDCTVKPPKNVLQPDAKCIIDLTIPEA